MGKMIMGWRYTNIQGTKNKTTTVTWEVQMERVFCCPSIVLPCCAFLGRKEEDIWGGKNEKMHVHFRPLLAVTKSPKMRVSGQESFSRGRRSQMKWSVTLGPHKGSQVIKRISVRVCRNPPAQATATRRPHTCLFIVMGRVGACRWPGSARRPPLGGGDCNSSTEMSSKGLSHAATEGDSFLFSE